MIDFLMQELSKELEINPPLKAEVRGTYIVPLGENLNITISTLPYTGIMFTANLGGLPENHYDEFLENLLRANLFGEGTRGAVLGLSANGSEVTLNRTIEYRIDYPEFRNILEDFINVADFWRDEAKELEAKSA